MYSLTVTATAPHRGQTTNHRDRCAAAAALADYITDTDTDPRPNQITREHASYDLISLAHHSVAATAVIEPTGGATS